MAPVTSGTAARMYRGQERSRLSRFLSIITLAIIILSIVPVFFEARSSAEMGSPKTRSEPHTLRGLQSGSALATAKPTGSSDLPEIAPKIVKSGETGLELEKGGFEAARDEVYLIVDSSGGYIETENTTVKNGSVNGSFLIRVPFDRFDETFSRVGGLGRKLGMEVASQDVTEECIDLEGRLRHMEAEEQFYLGLMGQAGTIEEMTSIREKLSAVELEKEQALGRKNYLENQAAYSLITLTMQEEPILAPVAGTGFWGRLGAGLVSFGRACREVTVWLAYACPTWPSWPCWPWHSGASPGG